MQTQQKRIETKTQSPTYMGRAQKEGRKECEDKGMEEARPNKIMEGRTEQKEAT